MESFRVCAKSRMRVFFTHVRARVQACVSLYRNLGADAFILAGWILCNILSERMRQKRFLKKSKKFLKNILKTLAFCF